jgi:hypothetical protein
MKASSGFLREGDYWEVKLVRGDCTLKCKNHQNIKYVDIRVRASKTDYSLKNYATIMVRKQNKKDFCALTFDRNL